MKQNDPWYAQPRAALSSQGPDHQTIAELVKVLAGHPGGLRRWSVMRAIRAERDRASRPVSLKFEAEVERAFKSSCTGSDALFYKPEGKAGEVWAVHLDRAGAWLQPSPSANDPGFGALRHGGR